MSKVLTDEEVLDIVKRIIVGDEIDDSDYYEAFLEDLGYLIAHHMGGELLTVSRPFCSKPDEVDKSADRYCLHFRHNESVPEGGGVYADYDKDVSVEEWIADSQR